MSAFQIAPAPVLRVRRAIIDWLKANGYTDVVPGGIDIRTSIGPIGLPFAPAPKLDAIEQLIVDAIEQAGGPLQQKEIASAAKISRRHVSRFTGTMVERGLLVKHPTQGFYVPGMVVGD